MFLQRCDLSTALRPVLLPDENLLFIQDRVGLYEGKYKIATCQNGQAYLTSHRVCYVDNTEPRQNSFAIDLRDVEKYEFQAGFLRSSPKITLYPKLPKDVLRATSFRRDGPISPAFQRLSTQSSPVSRTSSPARGAASRGEGSRFKGTWICPICTSSNEVPSNFDHTSPYQGLQIPPCIMCGMAPPYSVVLKAAVAAAASAAPAPTFALQSPIIASREPSVQASGAAVGLPIDAPSNICPLCTFSNYPSLHICEMCGTPLPKAEQPSSDISAAVVDRSQSPGPQLANLNIEDSDPENIKLSFRGGGDKVFYDRLKGAMIQRRWLLLHAPPVPRPNMQSPSSRTGGGPSYGASGSGTSTPRSSQVGIAGLEQRGIQGRKNNEAVIGSAFEDLEALMASAKDIVALAQKFAIDSGSERGAEIGASNTLLSESATALGMSTTKDMLAGSSERLYISELARDLAEYIADERGGVLRNQGGIMSLVDLWALFNKSRNGVELISPSDFKKATEMWESLRLPVRLRRFKSGLLAVQRADWTDEKTLRQLRSWFDDSRKSPPSVDVAWDWETFGVGFTAQDAAHRFGWSIGVAAEELEMAEDNGMVCREESVQGLRFWLNHIVEAE